MLDALEVSGDWDTVVLNITPILGAYLGYSFVPGFWALSPVPNLAHCPHSLPEVPLRAGQWCPLHLGCLLALL